VADVKAMLGLQMVTMTMDTTPLGRIGNIEAVDLFNQPNQQLLWARDFKASSRCQNPSVNSGFTKGFFFVRLAGGGWFGVAYSLSRAQSWAQLGTTSRSENSGRARVRSKS
jgi:hypothetical protein